MSDRPIEEVLAERIAGKFYATIEESPMADLIRQDKEELVVLITTELKPLCAVEGLVCKWLDWVNKRKGSEKGSDTERFAVAACADDLKDTLAVLRKQVEK